MPLYDCVMLLKPQIKKEVILDLVGRVGKHIYARNGVITDVKSFGTVQLGYGIKKLDGRYFQGQLMQMTMMATPNINKELHYLNKEDRLLRWLLVKHRYAKFGLEYELGDGNSELSKFRRSKLGLEYLGDDNKVALDRFTRPGVFDSDDEDDDDEAEEEEEYELKAEEADAEKTEV